MPRIGLINIMPRLEHYEPLVIEPILRADPAVEIVRIRLASHGYNSSDHAYLDRHYRTFAGAGPLDGLIVTGAPVEELAFEEVSYWPELAGILEHARTRITSTLGLCWGGLALARLAGVPKLLYPRKLFGVYEHRQLVADHVLLADQPAVFRCAHSRHAGIADTELERAQADGRLRLLAHAPATGYVLFETPDHRFVAHLGHPEYVAERLVFEWERDRARGRSDVPAPHDFDPAHPITSWHDHRERLLAAWLRLVGGAR